MSPPDDLYPPVTHGSGWAVLAVVVLGVVVVWWLGLWWFTRCPPTGTPAWSPLRGRALAARRARGVAEIDAVVRAHVAGLISTRHAFQQLSPVVRRFVFEAAGVPAHTMALADLEREHPGLLADVIALMYPAEFAAAVHGDVVAAGERAREVVLGWRAPSGRTDVATGASP